MPKTAIRGNAIVKAWSDSDRGRTARSGVKIVVLKARVAARQALKRTIPDPGRRIATNKEGGELSWITKK
jgi:hypothetical protein